MYRLIDGSVQYSSPSRGVEEWVCRLAACSLCSLYVVVFNTSLLLLVLVLLLCNTGGRCWLIVAVIVPGCSWLLFLLVLFLIVVAGYCSWLLLLFVITGCSWLLLPVTVARCCVEHLVFPLQQKCQLQHHLCFKNEASTRWFVGSVAGRQHSAAQSPWHFPLCLFLSIYFCLDLFRPHCAAEVKTCCGVNANSV